jgi:hypothetical protein
MIQILTILVGINLIILSIRKWTFSFDLIFFLFQQLFLKVWFLRNVNRKWWMVRQMMS